MKRLFLIVIVTLTALSALCAQPRGGNPRGGQPQYRGGQLNQSRGTVFGTVVLSSEEKGKPETPGAGVVVLVITEKKDTLYTTSSERGFFRISNVPIGKAYVSFSLMGYKSEAHWVDISPGQNRMIANLQPDEYEIAAAVVRETVPPVSIIRDTLVFNAAAVKVNKGEKAIDILEQMPGVEVGDGSVKVLNETVQNVYIDGALLFGNAPMKALNNLDAEEVKTIKSYQEYANKDPYHKISKTEEKQRVLDIATKNRPKAVMALEAISGAGFDTDSTYHKFRYTIGADALFFSESLQGGFSFNVNNINDGSNRRRGNSFRTASGGGSADLRSITVSASGTKKWMSPTTRNFVLGQVSGSYSYSNKYDVTESISQILYFEDGDSPARTVDKRSYSDVTGKTHSGSVSAAKALRDGKVGLSASVSFSHDLTNSASCNYTSITDLRKQGTSTSRNKDGTGRSYDLGFNFSKGWLDKFRVKFDAGFSAGDNDALTAKKDSTTSTITHKVLEITGQGANRTFNVSPSLRYEIDDNNALTLSYSYKNTYRESDQISFDVLNNTEDLVNSRRFTVDNNTHNATLGYNHSFSGDSETILRVRAGYKSVGLNRNETYPNLLPYDRRFGSFHGSVNIGTESLVNRWRISYSTDCSTPSLEQIRPKIDNSNLYSVTVGNPDLDKMRSHSFNAFFSTPVGGESKEAVESGHGSRRGLGGIRINDVKMFSAEASFNMTTGSITRRQLFFAEETFLPEYGYTMPAQSTLDTYLNGGTAYSASGNVSYSTPVEFLKSILSADASMSWDKAPSYLSGTLVTTENLSPTLRMGLRTNFSRDVRINLGLRGAYVDSRNSLGNSTDYFTERINVGWELNNVFDIFYAGGNYYKLFTQGLDYGKLSDNIMNVNLGAKWGPKNNYDLSVAVHDLFNTTTGFSTSMSENHITNTWRHQFGRYVMFHFIWRWGNSSRRR